MVSLIDRLNDEVNQILIENHDLKKGEYPYKADYSPKIKKILDDIDENHNNWLVTNLEPLCVHCHQKFHYKHYKMPYASITVESHFSSGHFLPSYDGACNRCHAHGWKYSVTVRKRINPDTGMVMDY